MHVIFDQSWGLPCFGAKIPISVFSYFLHHFIWQLRKEASSVLHCKRVKSFCVQAASFLVFSVNWMLPCQKIRWQKGLFLTAYIFFLPDWVNFQQPFMFDCFTFLCPLRQWLWYTLVVQQLKNLEKNIIVSRWIHLDSFPQGILISFVLKRS